MVPVLLRWKGAQQSTIAGCWYQAHVMADAGLRSHVLVTAKGFDQKLGTHAARATRLT